MLLIHVPRLTNRVGYTLNVLFHYILKVDFEITTDIDIFENYEGAKLCYGQQKIGDGLFIRANGLLFQTTIEEQSPRCFKYADTVALFPVHSASADLPFDLLAASFYCLSRYEEYLPHLTDIHGRFPASESLAFKEGFLTQAVVDRWVLMFADIIRQRYPEENIPQRFFDFEDTFDIDAAYCYRNKGFLRTVVGMGRDLFSRRYPNELSKRIRVLLRKESDPFDSFDYIIGLHQQHPHIRLKFFPLMADYNVYDKPISYQNDEFQQLLKHLGDYAKIGLHASYVAHDNPRKIAVESERLEALLHRRIVRNRYHFLRLTLPESYNALIDNGIMHDYTMGFADEPGFRAGTGNPYPFFDLESDSETQLTIHPFVIMDATFLHYKKELSLDEVKSVYFSLIDESKTVGGVFSALWHNQTLCDNFGCQGWKELYEKVLQKVEN